MCKIDDQCELIHKARVRGVGGRFGLEGNTCELVLMRLMNLEPLVQSEVNQKEKDKYCILTHIYGI